MQHERTHKRASLPLQESENHTCNICSKDYTRKAHLQKHMERAHLGIRYSCPFCEHKTITEGNLKVHIQSKHEGVKKLCNQCDYKAYDKPSLTKHVKAVHLNLKTHKCPSCDVARLLGVCCETVKHDPQHVRLISSLLVE